MTDLINGDRFFDIKKEPTPSLGDNERGDRFSVW